MVTVQLGRMLIGGECLFTIIYFFCLGHHTKFLQGCGKESHNTLSDTLGLEVQGNDKFSWRQVKENEWTLKVLREKFFSALEIVQVSCITALCIEACNLMETWVPLDQSK